MSNQKFTQENPLPERQAGAAQDLMLASALKSGQTNTGNLVQLFKIGAMYKLFVSVWQGEAIVLQSKNPNTLEKFFSEVYAPIEWR